MTTMLWRRLDAPGHDAAALVEHARGAELRGMAVFRDDGGVTALHYHVTCDAQWHTTEARVQGWRNGESIAFAIVRDEEGRWTLDGVPCPAVAGCPDVDLNFTPATNLLPLRRLDLSVGGNASVRSAWLEWPSCRLRPLVQRYYRDSIDLYRYQADLPDGTLFMADLRVDPAGWVLDYGDLWRAEP